MAEVRAITPPPESRLALLYADADLADAFAVALPKDAGADVVALARTVMAHPPGYMKPLMRFRDAVMIRFGIKTSTQIRSEAMLGPLGAMGTFTVVEILPNEVVMGEKDRHLDFKTSFLIRPGAEGRDLIWVSAVHCNNAMGRLYLAAITPFHRLLVPSFLARTSRAGWPPR